VIEFFAHNQPPSLQFPLGGFRVTVAWETISLMRIEKSPFSQLVLTKILTSSSSQRKTSRKDLQNWEERTI
jgi:hypothetical protein